MPVLLSAHPVIVFAFDPLTQVGGYPVRLETLVAAAAILVGILLAAVIAPSVPVDVRLPASLVTSEGGERNHLRRDDLLYIVVAAFPGAVIGGRLGYALLHLDYYSVHQQALLDISQGGLHLSLGLVGGIVTAGIVAALLGAPLGRWLHALILPLLVTLALVKVAMAFGGEGQGLPFDGSWATMYTGAGPWGSLAPEIPSHPSQLYEAAATGVVALVVLWVMILGVFNRRNGAAFLLGIALWAGARAAVATTWRDPEVMAGLSMDQVVSILIAAVSAILLVIVMTVGTMRGHRESAARGASPA